MKYVSKQDVINKGIVKKEGKIRKLSILEIWYSKGYLEYDKSRYDSRERLKYGLKLALDYQIINRANLRSSYINNSRIDKTGQYQSVALFESMDRYNKALRAIPTEFWPIVRRICIEDNDIILPKNLSERQKSYIFYLSRIDLCRGLDRVISEYTKKLNM